MITSVIIKNQYDETLEITPAGAGNHSVMLRIRNHKGEEQSLMHLTSYQRRELINGLRMIGTGTESS